MSSLRVLITNNTLAPRAGTELYVRDLASTLLRRGHTPIAYSTLLGEVAHELRTLAIPVIDDLDRLATPPDVIHGHHHLETMTALLHFPGVPAISVCHGWLPWEEAPPQFPRILRYAAVDEACRDRFVCEHGIPEARVRLIPNFVDLERFRPRGPLPPRPRRALILNNHASEHNYLAAVLEACTRTGMQLDVRGAAVGNVCSRPEAILGDYDLVFATGRSALEALAVGTAVVLCHLVAGPMVTSAELARLQAQNFGYRAVGRPVRADFLAQEIARYDPADAAEVSRRVRASAGCDRIVDTIIDLYHEVVDEHRAMGTAWSRQESLAASVYVRGLTSRLKESAQLRAELAAHQKELARLREQLAVVPRSAPLGLRNRLVRLPVLGRLARSLAQLTRR